MPVHKNKAFVSQSGITIAGADTDPDDIANAMHKRMSRVSRRTRKNQAAKAEMELSPQRLVQMRTDWDAGWEKKIRTETLPVSWYVRTYVIGTAIVVWDQRESRFGTACLFAEPFR